MMNQFMFIYRSMADMPEMSAEQMQENMQAWIEWISSSVDAGWMLQPGDALLPGVGKVVQADTISDGPFIESKEIVGGYSIVQADNISAAASLTANCPALRYGGKVEVRQLMMVDTTSAL